MNRNLPCRWLSVFLAVVLAFASLAVLPKQASMAGPATITVTTTQDLSVSNTSACSLRMAVIATNEGHSQGGCPAGTIGPDTIILPASVQHYMVNGGPDSTEGNASTGDLDIKDSVTIIGAGMGNTIIASGGSDRVFHVFKLGSAVVNIQRLTITGGANVDAGGGIFNEGSTLILQTVTVTGNTAKLRGGGISNNISLSPSFKPATLIVRNSIISSNTSDADGGGIDNAADLNVMNTLVYNNTASSNGGGISNNPFSGYSAVITNTTFTKNKGLNGSGLYVRGTLTSQNNTIYDNPRPTGVSSAIAGIYIHQTAAFTLNNTIIGGNVAYGTNCLIVAGASVTSNLHNLEDSVTTTCGLTPSVNGDFVNVSAGLDAFGAYGSNTQLYGLLAGSKAIDNGSNATCPPTDQRGINFGRWYGSACDIGAFESNAFPPQKSYLPSILH